MLIAGLDLAAQPEGSALAVLQWSAGAAKLVDLQVGVEDQDVVALAPTLFKLGIDCALGWPREFLSFLTEYSQASLSGLMFDGGIDWRRRLAHRETDREVQRITGRWPLSVSTDRLGMTAMRCAGLLSKLQHAGESIDRAGLGKVVEIYPAASMRIWGLQIAGYRSSIEIRQALIAQLEHTAPWLDLADFKFLMVKSCDAFDAVVAALAASAAAFGKSTRPSDQQLAAAQIEGWVALPNSALHELGLQ
jgi:predicted nuclease with RNAse H fold